MSVRGSEGIGVPPQEQPASSHSPAEDLAAVDRAIAALEAQRALLGDAVVETALAPLKVRRDELAAPRSEQRRLVTVVFADLVDFTVLSRKLDAEDTREVVGAYFARWQRAIEDEGGVVEKFIGDAVMAVFGLERSFEDDAQRAIRSALRMLAELETLNAELGPRLGVTLHMRTGIDTGEVVVSTLDERPGHGFVAVGPTVNRASRLQAAAPIDQVMISVETLRQVRGSFSIEARPHLVLKGIDEPVDAFVVTGERRQQFRLDPTAGVEGVETTTVGRELSLRFLQDRLADVTEESRWRLVTVMGDAGVGKSRLLLDFDAWLAEQSDSFWWFRGRAAAGSRTSSNALLRDVIASRLDIAIDDPADVVRQKLTDAFVHVLGSERGQRLGAVALAWLGYELSGETVTVPQEPQALRDAGTAAVGTYFAELSKHAPVVMLLEDLHWADEGTLRWLDAVEAIFAQSRIFVVATSRPTLLEDHPRWGEGLGHHVRLDLAPLTRRESRALVRQILQRVRDLPDDLVDLVVEHAEGNPFYLEELITWLIDAGVVVRSETAWSVAQELVRTVAVPSTLKGVLQARLDALSREERDLLQRASVVGRVFWDLAVAHLDDEIATAGRDQSDELPERERSSLEHLRRRELLLQREVSHFATAREFLFKHALLRDVAYDGVLRAPRERYHRRAAGWLVDTSTAAGREDEYAALIADHFDRARDPAAAGWYLRSGRQAASVYALDEALELFGRALELSPEDGWLLRFDVHLAREGVLDRAGDRTAQEADLHAMEELAPHLDEPRRLELLLSQAEWRFLHSEYDAAASHCDQAVELASSLGRPDLLARALLWQGKNLTWSRDPDAARERLECAVEEARAAGLVSVLGESLRYLAMVAGNVGDYPRSVELGMQAREVFAGIGDVEMESASLAQLATTYFKMGDLSAAQAVLEETLPIFRNAGHRYRETINTGNLAAIALTRGRYAQAREWADQARRMAEELDDLEAAGSARLVLAISATMTGRFEEAEEQCEHVLRTGRKIPVLELECDSLTRQAALAVVRRDESALLEAQQAVTRVRDLPSDRDQGDAQLILGYAATAAGLLDEAFAAFAAAEELLSGDDFPAQVREAVAGRARVLSAQGEHARAVALIEPILEHLGPDDMVWVNLPGELLTAAWTVLRAAGDPRADGVLGQAQTTLRTMGELTGDPDLEAGFLALPTHADLLAAGPDGPD